MISLALLAVALVAAVVVIAYNLALYAMPVMVGAAAFNVAHAGGAGVLLSGLAAAVAVAAVASVVGLLALARNPLVRLGSAALFAGPASIAGYALVHGVVKHAITAPVAAVAISAVGGLVVGAAALSNLMALAAPER